MPSFNSCRARPAADGHLASDPSAASACSGIARAQAEAHVLVTVGDRVITADRAHSRQLAVSHADCRRFLCQVVADTYHGLPKYLHALKSTW